MNIFYTADTKKEYVVKTATRRKLFPPGSPATVTNLQVLVNRNVTPDSTTIYIQTEKPIIPLYFIFTYVGTNNVGTLVQYAVATPYYFVSKQGISDINFSNYVKVQTKIIPYTNNQNPFIGFQWNNIDWNETDFIDMSGNGATIIFGTSFEYQLNNGNDPVTIPATLGGISFCTSFLYLELQ
jgi:hypothetical protein